MMLIKGSFGPASAELVGFLFVNVVSVDMKYYRQLSFFLSLFLLFIFR